MEKSPGWVTEKTGQAPMRSPGRPGVNQRKTKQAFWKLIAAGVPSEDAALACSMSHLLGLRRLREVGGMRSISLEPDSRPYLSFAEREALALLRVRDHEVREIARQLGRSASTGSCELRPNAATRGGKLQYRATVAQWEAEQAAR